ncbi:tyrosine-type recombinase/integrase [Chitinophaga pollutisoli]|uniref:Tyrosine-type recombinase/integrase n=1 Tax=Chitinophaga pollutisoli TaxID=3133966 RepID=A0ABZ2YSX4_9BACT
MAAHTLSLDFITRKDKKDANRVCIFGRITIDGPPKEFSLGEFISAEKWDPDSESVRGKNQEAKDINNYIQNVRTKVRNLFRNLSETQEHVTALQVKDAYTGKSNKGHTIDKLFERHEKKFMPELKAGTWKNFITTRKYVLNFVQHQFKQKDAHIKVLNYEFMLDLEAYIIQNPIDKSKPCKGNGLAHHLERFKGIIKWGENLGWFKQAPFSKFKVSRAKVPKVKLRPHQLKLIETKRLSDPQLDYVRDLFMFSCFTGFAFAEVSRLSMNDFEISSNGKFWCTMYRQKTIELEAVPLIDQAVALVKKYKDRPESVANGTVFPPVTNQHVNRCLKILTEIFGIGFPLRFHRARHTFGYYAIKAGVDIKIIKEIMGHTKLTTTDLYTMVDEEMAEEAMIKVQIATDKRKMLPSPGEFISNSRPSNLR